MVPPAEPHDVLKGALKEALREVIAEEHDTLRSIAAEVLEDLAFGRAMQEGEETDVVSRERIFDLLEGRG
jgi:hypothetical protein